MEAVKNDPEVGGYLRIRANFVFLRCPKLAQSADDVPAQPHSHPLVASSASMAVENQNLLYPVSPFLRPVGNSRE